MSFEPFANNRRSKDIRYTFGALYEVYGDKPPLMCKNCKCSQGRHYGVFAQNCPMPSEIEKYKESCLELNKNSKVL